MRKPPRRETCSYDNCTKGGQYMHPIHNNMLCPEHLTQVFNEIKEHSRSTEVDKYRTEIAESIKGDWLMKLVQDRDLSFSEKVSAVYAKSDY